MKKIPVLPVIFGVAFVFLCNLVSAQLVNDGAIIKIQPGAVIFCAGNFENKNSGSVSNDGKLEVQGNFLNSATYNSATADDSLILSGAGNVTFNGGASTFTNLWINKAGATDRVTLTATALLSGKLDYDQGVFTTDPIANPSYLFSAPTTAVFDFAAGKEIIGNVRRTGWANGAAVVFNQPNMLVTTNAGTAPTDVTVTMIPLTESGNPTDNEREVKRKFQFAQTGGTGFTADVRFPYVAGELNTNVDANLVPWGRFTAVWNGRLTPVSRLANTWVSTTGITQTDFINEWKLADPKYTFNITAYLKGAWNNPAANMRTLLNSSALLPLSQQYTGAPFNYAGTESVGAIPNANVTDWVLVELRMPANGLPASALAATFVGRKAAFVLNTGAIVDLDGVTPLTIDINKQGAGFFVVRHRNHLGIMSNSLPSNTTGSYANNFSSSLTNYYTNVGATSAPATVLSASAPGNGLYGMWPGDVNVSRAVTSTDISLINVALAGPASGNTSVYSSRDVTLDRNVTSTDISQTNASLAATAQQNPPAKIQVGSGDKIKKLISHVPGETPND